MVGAGQELAEQVAPVNAAVKTHLIHTEEPIHIDQTRLRVEGGLQFGYHSYLYYADQGQQFPRTAGPITTR